MIVIGLIYLVFPSKKRDSRYGYRTPRAKYSESTYDYAQKKASSLLLLIGGITFLVGVLLKKTNNLQYFILELFLIGIPIIMFFYLVERRLEGFNDALINQTKLNEQSKEEEDK